MEKLGWTGRIGNQNQRTVQIRENITKHPRQTQRPEPVWITFDSGMKKLLEARIKETVTQWNSKWERAQIIHKEEKWVKKNQPTECANPERMRTSNTSTIANGITPQSPHTSTTVINWHNSLLIRSFPNFSNTCRFENWSANYLRRFFQPVKSISCFQDITWNQHNTVFKTYWWKISLVILIPADLYSILSKHAMQENYNDTKKESINLSL